MQNVIQENLSLLAQVKTLLTQLTDDMLTTPHGFLLGSSVGKHFRHILEFYECLSAQASGSMVSYDARSRKLPLENHTTVALDSATASMQWLTEQQADMQLYVGSQLSTAEAVFVQRSSLRRELVFVADHTVHHLAIIRIGIQHAYPDIDIAPEVGISASTLKHQHTVCAH